MASGEGPAQRLFSAGKRLLESLLATGETRLRLAVVELEEERARLATLLLLIGLSLVMAMLGLTVLILLVAVLFWDTHRLAALAICAVVLLGGSLALVVMARNIARRHSFMQHTLAQLATDRELLERPRDTSR